MSIHNKIRQLVEDLGYCVSPGFCNGMSLRWLEAAILQENESLTARLNIINNETNLVEKITKVKKKHGKNLTPDDEKYLDILAFIESLVLFQSPSSYSPLFNKSLSQQEFEKISRFASAEKILQLGGLKTIYSAPFISTQQEISEYLSNLGKILDSACANEKRPIGILLSNHNHTITLSYEANRGWSFMDINQYPVHHFDKDQTFNLAAALNDGFKSLHDYNAFNVNVILPHFDSRCGILTEKLANFKKGHLITQEIAHRSEAVNLAYIAAEAGEAEIVAELAEYGADLNKVNSMGCTPAYAATYNGHTAVLAILAGCGADLNKAELDACTPAYAAAKMGRPAVLAILAKYGADLNKVDSMGCTPAYIAAEMGHPAVLAKLAEYGADLNKATFDGCTPAYIAAYNGDIAVLAKLAECGADLNKANFNGYTPVHAAAGKGHPAVIDELAKYCTKTKYRAMLNKAVFGCTPAYIAAEMGHPAVLAKLAKHGANFNKANFDGTTPVFIAAQNGHLAALKQLIHYKASMNIPSQYSIEKLTQFAHFQGEKVLNRMNQFINQSLPTYPPNHVINMRPYDIAVIMGQHEVVQYLNELENGKKLLGKVKEAPEPGKDYSTVTHEERKAIFSEANASKSSRKEANKTSRLFIKGIIFASILGALGVSLVLSGRFTPFGTGILGTLTGFVLISIANIYVNAEANIGTAILNKEPLIVEESYKKLRPIGKVLSHQNDKSSKLSKESPSVKFFYPNHNKIISAKDEAEKNDYQKPPQW